MEPRTSTLSRRSLLTTSAVAGGAALLAGCTAGSPGSASSTPPAAQSTGSAGAPGAVADRFRNKTIGVPVLNFADENQVVLAAQLQTAAKAVDLGWTFNVVNCQGNQAQAQAALSSMITSGVDMIVDIVVFESLVGAELAEAAKAQIPVVGLFGFSPPTSPNFLVDYYAVHAVDAALLTEYMFWDLQKRFPGDAPIKIAAFDAPLDIIKQRRAVLKGLLPDWPRIQLVAEQYAIDPADPVASTTEAVNAVLTQHADLAGLWTNFPPIGPVAAAAVTQRKRQDGVKVYSHVAGSAGLDAVGNDDSPLVATSWTDIVFGAHQCVDNMLNILAGNSVSRLTQWLTPIPSAVIDKSNFDTTQEVDAGDAGTVRQWMADGGTYRQEFYDRWRREFSS